MISRRAKKILNLLTALTITGLAACADIFAWHPWLDDGPFYPEFRRDLEDLGQPHQVFVGCAGSRIEVYNRKGSEVAPTVVVRDDLTGYVRSAFIAAATPNTVVDSLTFRSKRCPNWTAARILRGDVRWTYGEERALFFLRPDDSVREYWYSW